jgi:hypothetical protein
VCSVQTGDGSYSIVKILVREVGAIHVRIYKEKFGWRPERVDTETLSLGTVHDEDGVGIGHLPLAEEVFGSWDPVVIGREAVSDEEREGYLMRKEGSGKVWR